MKALKAFTLISLLPLNFNITDERRHFRQYVSESQTLITFWVIYGSWATISGCATSKVSTVTLGSVSISTDRRIATINGSTRQSYTVCATESTRRPQLGGLVKAREIFLKRWVRCAERGTISSWLLKCLRWNDPRCLTCKSRYRCRSLTLKFARKLPEIGKKI